MEVAFEYRKDVTAACFGCCALRHFFAAATCGKQADADFDEADVTFQCGDDAGAMDGKFAASAECQAIHCGNSGYLRIFETHRNLLEFGDYGFDLWRVAGSGIDDIAQATAARDGEFDAAGGLFEFAKHACVLRWCLHALH